MALVAAMAVAFVVMAILVVVVMMTISAVNKSGRDRVRTEGIHSAEGAVDATMAAMENAVICGSPPFSPIAIGKGSQSNTVTVEVEYYKEDFSTRIYCVAGAPTQDPKFAIVRATSKPTTAVLGLQPVRIIEANVALKSRGGSVKLPGIYSAHDMTMEGTPDVFSEIDDGTPDIWIDNGNFYCNPTINRQLQVEADVVVANGNAYLQQYCWLDRNVYVDGDTFFKRSSPSGSQLDGYVCNKKNVCGDFVGTGKLVIDSDAGGLTSAGDVTLGDSLYYASRLRADGAVTTNDVDVEQKASRGFPTVNYVYANWQREYGMQEKSVADFVGRLAFKSGKGPSNVAKCDYDSYYYNSTIKLTSTPTVYDMRETPSNRCSTVQFSGTNTIKVYADTAFIVTGFFNSGTLNFESGDGAHHDVWFIVPDAGVPAYYPQTSCSSPARYNLCSVSVLTSTQNVPIMWYTKQLFYLDGKSASQNDVYGQVFAGSVYFKGYLDLEFESLSIPGEILWQPGADGFDVQLLSKEEVPSS